MSKKRAKEVVRSEAARRRYLTELVKRASPEPYTERELEGKLASDFLVDRGLAKALAYTKEIFR
jgi:hypothetical protein